MLNSVYEQILLNKTKETVVLGTPSATVCLRSTHQFANTFKHFGITPATLNKIPLFHSL